MKQGNKSMRAITQTAWVTGRLQYNDERRWIEGTWLGGRKKYAQAYLRTWYTGNESMGKSHAECWRIIAMVLEKTLESPLDCKEIQSILKEINPEYSLKGLMLKLKLQYFGQHHDVKRWLTGKDLDVGKDWRQKVKRTERMSWLDGIIDSMDMSLS